MFMDIYHSIGHAHDKGCKENFLMIVDLLLKRVIA